MDNFHKFLKIVGSVCAFVGLAAYATSASANLVPSFTTHTTLLGVTTWNYHVQLDNLERLVKNQDYFVIYDFDGFTGAAPTIDARFKFLGTSLVGPYPPGPPNTLPQESAFDSASVPNLTFSYIGPPQQQNGPKDYGIFSIKSFYSNEKFGRFASQVHVGNNPHSDEGNTLVPTSVPEVGSLALLLPGLIPVGIVLSRLRKNRTKS